jgi:hypothetical protein
VIAATATRCPSDGVVAQHVANVRDDAKLTEPGLHDVPHAMEQGKPSSSSFFLTTAIKSKIIGSVTCMTGPLSLRAPRTR